jgi:hypothetical protein
MPTTEENNKEQLFFLTNKETPCMHRNNQAEVAMIFVLLITGPVDSQKKKKKLDLSGEYYAKDARVISPDTNQIKLARNK